MTGKQAIASHEQRIVAAFDRAARLNADSELLSDFAKYLCILVAGYIEKTATEIALEHARRCGAPSLQRFVEKHTKNFTNANSAKFVQFFGAFDPDWLKHLEGVMVDEYKEAFDSIYGLRNTIAHGGSTGVTFARVKDYFNAIQLVVEETQKLCIP